MAVTLYNRQLTRTVIGILCAAIISVMLSPIYAEELTPQQVIDTTVQHYKTFKTYSSRARTSHHEEENGKASDTVSTATILLGRPSLYKIVYNPSVLEVNHKSYY